MRTERTAAATVSWRPFIWIALLSILAPAFVSAGDQISHPVSNLTVDQAEARLREGNARFVSQEMTFPNQDLARLTAIVDRQQPFAVVVTCSDSRVPAELIFDAGLGELFVVRVAGNVADIDEIASVEYAIAHLGTPLVIVLGHTDCDAIAATVGGKKQPGLVSNLTDNISDAVKRAQRRLAGLPPDTATLLSCTTQENVWTSIEDLITQSPDIYDRTMDGRIRMIGGIYNVASGKVQWLGVHPRQQCLDLAEETAAERPAQAKVKTARSAPERNRDASHPEGVSADLAQMLLREGNKRFVAGNRNHPNLNPSRLEEIASDQHPYATVLSCSDSRVAPEHIFDAGLGDIFVVRVAGNVADVSEIGSIESGVSQLHTPLLVVMGHTGCGAVTTVVEGTPRHGVLAQLTDNIVPAVKAARSALPTQSTAELLPEAIRANVWQSINDIVERSDETRRLISGGFLQIVGAVYHLDDGYVEWLGPHPDQKKIMAKHTHQAKPAVQQEFGDQDESQNAYQDDYSDN